MTSTGRFISSIIYEENGSDELVLNMVTAQITHQMHDTKESDEEMELDYPQQPVAQSWIVDYPLLAYKTYTPMNREIAIMHLSLDMPQRIIHLGMWEFVSFVNHTQMVEQKCFEKDKETNCDIMLLVRHIKNGKTRLMSFKSNPWLQFYEQPNDADKDIYKEAIFLFSGIMPSKLTEDEEGE